jgi:predicted nucleic acid-binding protein
LIPRHESRLDLDAVVGLDEVVTCLPVVHEVLQGLRDERHSGSRTPGVDCLIGACAIRNGLTVVHQDRDNANLAKVSPLRERSLAV